MICWDLPQAAVIGGVEYRLNTDYRNIFEIFSYLNDQERPLWLRWQIAVGLFFEGEIPDEFQSEAMEYLASFIACGEEDSKPGPKLLDWEQDAQIVAADINKVAGTEIRALPQLHWWTFLSYFRAIGEGQLSTIVSIREKLRTGKKLDKWEEEYYHKNPERVNLKTYYLAEEEAEFQRMAELLGG
jgi:hypothetical protein